MSIGLRIERLVGKRLFYGWVIVLVSFISSLIIGGVRGWGLPFFILPTSQELGASRTEFSGFCLFRLLPFLGFLVDKRHGPRLLMMAGALLGGLALILTSQVQEAWHFYLTFGVLFNLATLLIEGQLVGPAILSKWFIRMRGRAIAIEAMGISGGGLLPPWPGGWSPPTAGAQPGCSWGFWCYWV
ncbi:MAG: hypothetical protein EXR55_06235 [Dehalococcoidia bacterium]|nr:hypothetical protein [Dehalococcoidia bacterium]